MLGCRFSCNNFRRLESKQMAKLNDVREMIDKIEDREILESGQQLLREMMRIAAIEEELKVLNDGLTEGGKAVFYFFAAELDEDERVYAAERITGRIKRIDRQNEAEKKKLPPPEEDV